MAVKARALGRALARLGAALWHLGEAPVAAPGAEPFERWLWPLGTPPAACRAANFWGITVWLTVGPPPYLPACRQEARLAGLRVSDVLLVPVPHLPLLYPRLCAALAAPQVAVVLLDARGWEAEAIGLLTSRRFYGPLCQRRPGAGARLLVLGHTFG